MFNEGHTATSGDQWIRRDLCAEALRLGRMLAALTPRDTETLGLLALMELQASRLRARTGPDGRPILLMDQDRTRWDRLLIQRGLSLLRRIERARRHGRARTPCRRRSRPATLGPGPPPDTDWHRITALYDGLAQISPSPVVELNRAVATAQAFGPEAGLAIVQPLFDAAQHAPLPPAARRRRRSALPDRSA